LGSFEKRSATWGQEKRHTALKNRGGSGWEDPAGQLDTEKLCPDKKKRESPWRQTSEVGGKKTESSVSMHFDIMGMEKLDSVAGQTFLRGGKALTYFSRGVVKQW